MSEPTTVDQQITDLDAQIAALHEQRAAAVARQFVAEHLAGETDQEKDEGLLRIVGNHLEQRLADARAAGKAGWWSNEVTDTALMARLQSNLAAGDFLDVAAYAAMLHARKHR